MIPVEKWTHELDALFTANQTQLRRAAYKILGDWERSEDVVQDAYIKITEMPATQKVRQPLAYRFRIVRNLAIDQYRRDAFELDLFGTDEEGLHIPALTGTPETTAINRQHLELVAEALTKLPERTKRVQRFCFSVPIMTAATGNWLRESASLNPANYPAVPIPRCGASPDRATDRSSVRREAHARSAALPAR